MVFPLGSRLDIGKTSERSIQQRGGVLPAYRRKGIALALLNNMMAIVQHRGYPVFAFDTFPNMHPGMTILAMEKGFRLIKADFNSLYREYRLRFEIKLDKP